MHRTSSSTGLINDADDDNNNNNNYNLPHPMLHLLVTVTRCGKVVTISELWVKISAWRLAHQTEFLRCFFQSLGQLPGQCLKIGHDPFFPCTAYIFLFINYVVIRR